MSTESPPRRPEVPASARSAAFIYVHGVYLLPLVSWLVAVLTGFAVDTIIHRDTDSAGGLAGPIAALFGGGLYVPAVLTLAVVAIAAAKARKRIMLRGLYLVSIVSTVPALWWISACVSQVVQA